MQDIRSPKHQNQPSTRVRLSRAPSQATDENELTNADIRSMPEVESCKIHRGATQNVIPRLMRIKVGARYIAVRPAKLRQMIQNGDIPRILDRNADPTRTPWLVDRYDLDAWIDRNRETLN